MRFAVLDQRTDEWLAWRKHGVSATDSAVILNLSPYKTRWRLWAEKTDRMLPPDLSKNPNVQFGVQNEATARVLFEQKHGTFALPQCAEFDAEPIFRASFDGLLPDETPLEIKCPSTRTLEEVRTKGRDSEAFKLYNVQVQHQILVAGASHGWLVFYDPEARDLIEFDIERDDRLIERILTEGRAFYEMIVKDIEPERDPERDVFVPPEGEKRQAWIRAANDYLTADRDIKRLQAQLSGLLQVQSQAKSVLVNLLGGNLKGDFAGVSVTRSVVKGRLDAKRLCRIASGREPTEDELEAARSAPTERIFVRAAGDELPKAFVANESLKIADAPAGVWDGSFWF